ncbi:MAG: NUDIX domain-containing protein [Terriglobales bacterium]
MKRIEGGTRGEPATRPGDLARVIAELESFADSPERGLPEEVFQLVSRLTPLLSVDLLIQDDSERTLLAWRDDEAYGPGWHVPGGIIRYKERALDRLHAVARAELGAEVTCEPVPLAVVEHVKQESRKRGHVVSLLHRCRLLSPPDERLRFNPAVPKPGHWQWHARGAVHLIAEQQMYETYLR